MTGFPFGYRKALMLTEKILVVKNKRNTYDVPNVKHKLLRIRILPYCRVYRVLQKYCRVLRARSERLKMRIVDFLWYPLPYHSVAQKPIRRIFYGTIICVIL